MCETAPMTCRQHNRTSGCRRMIHNRGVQPALLKLALLSTVFTFATWAQSVPQMRSRYLTSLTNTEVEAYLQRNDIIFIPVGNVEVHGGLPTDCEYVGPLAFAQKMAEQTDGLVF